MCHHKNIHEYQCGSSRKLYYHVPNVHKNQVTNWIFSNDICEGPKSKNISPRKCGRCHKVLLCVLSPKRWMKKLSHQVDYIVSKKENEYHTCIHERVYHQKIKKDVSSSKNVLQSYISSPKYWMKFLQHQMN